MILPRKLLRDTRFRRIYFHVSSMPFDIYLDLRLFIEVILWTMKWEKYNFKETTKRSYYICSVKII